VIETISLFSTEILGIDDRIAGDQIAVALSARGDMATKQTRRSISVRGTTYESLRAYCSTHDRSMSEVVEEQLAKVLAAQARRGKTIAAHRVVRPSAAVKRAPAKASVGRPAPTPAFQVAGTRRVSAPNGDYRTIRF
jgi:hypothetical protein